MIRIARCANAVGFLLFLALPSLAQTESPQATNPEPALLAVSAHKPVLNDDMPCPQSLTILLNDFNNGDWYTRWTAADCMGKKKDFGATETLVRSLVTYHGDIRMPLMLQDALRRISDPHAGDLLLAALDVPAERETAIRCLGILQIKRGVDPLLEMLMSGSGADRGNAAEALGFMKDVRAIDPLSAELINPQSKLRYVAAEALGRIGSDRALTVLLNTLNDPDSNLRQISAEGLGEIKNSSAVPALAQKLADPKEDRDVVINSAEALGKIADSSAISALISGLYSGRRDAQWYSAQVLASIDQPEAMQALLSGVQRGNLNIVAAVYRELIRMGDDSFVPSLVEALNAHGDVYMARDYANSGNVQLAEAAHSSRFASELDKLASPDFSLAIWGSRK